MNCSLTNSTLTLLELIIADISLSTEIPGMPFGRDSEKGERITGKSVREPRRENLNEGS